MANNPRNDLQSPLLERCPKTQMWSDVKLDVRKVCFVWKINNFSLRPERVCQSIKSVKFSDIEDSKIKWSLRVYPNGINESNKEFVSLFLYLESSDRKEILAKYKFALLNDKGVQLFKYSSSAYFEVGKSWSDPEQHKFIHKSNLNDKLLANDTFTLLCEISYSLNTQTVYGRNSWFWWLSWIPKILGKRTKVTVERAKKTIPQQIGQLFDDPKFFDVILVAEGQEFRAHKLILSVRSPVFAAMFTHPLKESQNNRVDIKDINKQVFKELLRFIYTADICTTTLEMIAQLLSAADKYDLSDLKDYCEETLISKLCLETVCDLLLLADIHSAQELKGKAIQYIKANSNRVVKTEGWQRIVDNPQILNQCFAAVVL